MMADQIKNENVGEVSSPTPEEKVEVTTPAAPEEQAENTAPATPEEKAEDTPAQPEEQAEEAPVGEAPAPLPEKKAAAPKKAPSFAEPAKKAPPTFASDRADSVQAENKPEKKLPTFKTEGEGENGGKPQRKEPVIKPKERKFPVFANEVKQHQEDDEGDDIDFTSDSITMPFSIPATVSTVGVDASEVADAKGKKNKKNRKNEAAPINVAELENSQAGNMDQLDELSQINGAGGISGAGFDAAARPYVPTYDKENALLGAKQELANFAEPEPMPEYNPQDKSSDASKSAPAKKDPWVDPGIAEANSLLADNKAERQRRKTNKNQPASAPSEPVNVADASSGEKASNEPAENTSAPANVKPLDPGIEEAAALLETAAAEKMRLKALKAAKRDNKNGDETPAVVVETAEANASGTENATPTENAAPAVTPAKAENKATEEAAPAAAPAQDANTQSSAPLTNAEAPKKVMLLLPEEQSGMGVVASEGVEVEAYSVNEENQATPIPMKKVDASTGSYDKKKNKKDQNAELEALAVVYGTERAKQLSSGKKKTEKHAAHPDAEPYIAPVKASPVKESAPKAVSTAAYDAKKGAKDDKLAKREALAVVYGEEKARELAAKDPKADKSVEAAAAAVVYGDAEPYNAPVKAAPAAQTTPKAAKEIPTGYYSNAEQKKIDKQESKAEKKAEKQALLAVAAADKQKAKEDKAAAKEASKPVVAPVVTPVYGDSAPYYAPAKASAPAQAEPKAKKEFSPEAYANKQDKKLEKQEAKAQKKEEREALLAVAAADKQKAKEDKAAAKEASKPVVAPVVTPVYGDSEPYYAPAKATVPAQADPKAKKEFSPEAYANKQDKKLEKQEAKAQKKEEREALLAVAAADKQKAKEDKAAAKEASKPVVAPVVTPVYSDSEPYYAPAKATAPAQAEPKAKKEFSPEAYANKQDKKLEKQEAKAQKKEEREALLAVAAADKQKAKEDKAIAKAEAKDKAETPVAAPVYNDSNYDEGYDPSVFEKAPVAPDNSKAERKAEKNEAKNESAAAAYEKAKDKKNNRAATAAALVAFYNGNKPVKKTAEKEEPAPVAETVYPDVNYDEGYDPNWAANDKAKLDAEIAANREAREAQRHDAKAFKDAKRDAKNQHKYETHEEKVIREREQRDELLLTYKEEIAREKAAKAAAKAAISNTPEKSALISEVVYSDYTETFDKEAYEADKRAEADAKAQSVAKRKADKADKRLMKNATAEEKILADYDNATGRHITDMEKAAEMLAFDKQYSEEEKARAERARAADKAIAKANKSASDPSVDIEYPDYEEQFDETLYNTELENAKEVAAADELAKRNAKADKRNAGNNEYENKILASYDKATGKVVAAAEMEAEMLALNKQYSKEEKERAERARAAEKAIAKSERALKETDEIVYPDYEEQFDSDLYISELETANELASAEQLAKREQKLAKHNDRVNNRDAKAIAAYDKAVGTAIAVKEEEAEMLALNKQYTNEEKERAAKLRAADKAIAKAEKTLEPVYESIYPDITETFDEIQYSNDLQAEADAAIARDLKKHEAKVEKDIARKNAREDKLISNYDKALGKHINTEAQENEMVALARQDDKETKARAKKYKKLLEADMRAAVKADETGSHGVVYPDPEYLPDEFDDKFLELTAANPGDVIEGKIPRITSVREIRRAEREDKELALLVNKEKRRLKKIRYDIETLDIADKYVEDGSLEMADTRTVLKDAKRAEREDKDRRAVKEFEKDLEDKEMLYFAEDYDLRLKRNKKRLKRAKKYGKFMLEYGSTYDPEWDGDFNNYGLPEVHPYTEGVKLARGSRRRTPKKERLSHFDKKKLSELSRSQCKVDNKMIEARVQAEYTALQLEVSRVEQEFSGEYRTRKEKNWLRNSRAKLKNLKARIASALKYEKLDNERYYSVVATDFERVDLPAKADREELVAMREELMRLLDIRDEINTQLLELYTGTENGMRGSTKGRAKATLRARKWAHAKLMRYFRVLNKHRVTRNEKMRIFDKMDEVVDLKGQLARANYILRKERPVGKVKREYLKERKIAKRDIRILKKSIERSTVRALIKARKREKQERAMVLAYSIFALIALFVVAMVFMGPTIIEATKLLVPENFHKYLDIILKHWPL